MTGVASADDVAVGVLLRRPSNKTAVLNRSAKTAAPRTCERIEAEDVIGKIAPAMDHHVNPKQNIVRK